jgi:hypothetical protein
MGLFSFAKNLFSGAKNLIGNVAGKVGGALSGGSGLIGNLAGKVNAGFNNLPAGLQGMGQAFSGLLNVPNIRQSAQDLMSGVGANIRSVANGASISDAWNRSKQLFGNLTDNIGQGVQGAKNFFQRPGAQEQPRQRTGGRRRGGAMIELVN